MTKIINIPMGDDGTKKTVVTGSLNIDYSPGSPLSVTGLPFTNITGWCFFNSRELVEYDSAYSSSILTCSSLGGNCIWEGAGNVTPGGITTDTYEAGTLTVTMTLNGHDYNPYMNSKNGKYKYIIWGD